MNILTFDIEEWFHIKFDNEFLDNTKLLNSFEKRLDKNIYTIIDNANTISGTIYNVKKGDEPWGDGWKMPVTSNSKPAASSAEQINFEADKIKRP